MRVLGLCVLSAGLWAAGLWAVGLCAAGLWAAPAGAAPYEPVLKKNNDASLRPPHLERILQPGGVRRFTPSLDERGSGEERKRRRSN